MDVMQLFIQAVQRAFVFCPEGVSGPDLHTEKAGIRNRTDGNRQGCPQLLFRRQDGSLRLKGGF